MSAGRILIRLLVIWIGLGVLGLALHVVKLLLSVALLATVVVIATGLARR